MNQALLKMNSVKSTNSCQFVIQTIYDIVKAHRGEIAIDSKEGVGTEFHFLLPV